MSNLLSETQIRENVHRMLSRTLKICSYCLPEQIVKPGLKTLSLKNVSIGSRNTWNIPPMDVLRMHKKSVSNWNNWISA
jgi:hypothetical protein